MAVTPASVRAAHPELASCPDAVLTPAITAAELLHDSTVWGSFLDAGIDLWVCDYVSRSPFARDLRLQKDGERTVYRVEWERMRDQVAHAYRVLP